ncbi:acetyl-CoA synthetase-like protein [Mycena crocata]|nr:acetyl-CoA synthetase-like protein [Mycena crocata]
MRTVPHFPDDLTLPQFLFDYQHPIRLPRDAETPWIVDAVSGKAYLQEEASPNDTGRSRRYPLHYSFIEIIVGIVSSNAVDFPIVIWAAHRLGASAFTLNPIFNADELTPHLLDMKPALLFAHPAALEAVRAAAAQSGLSADKIVLLAQDGDLTTVQELIEIGAASKDTHQFTEFKLKPGEGKTKVALYFPSSGTTGVPKMAAIPHASVIANILQMTAHDAGTDETSIPIMERRFRPNDVSLAVLPFFHIFGLLINLNYHIFCGMVVVIMPKFDFTEYLSMIKRYKVNHLSIVPPIMVLFCKHPAVKAEDLTSLRVVFVGGAPVNVHFVQTMAALVPQAVVEQSYGMTEVAGILAMPPLDRRVGTGSGGRLLPGNTARVVKSDGAVAGPGETGELYIKGPSLAIHYVNNEKISADTFVDGWVRSGDECYFDENGEIYVVDRLKDFIKVRAFQVAPAELEARLAASPDVVDCCVVPVPHEFSGEIPKAYVVLTKAALERVTQNPETGENIKSALIQDIAENKAKYKALAGGVEFIDAIPRNAAGKLLRRVLRAKALEDPRPAAALEAEK